MFRLPLFLIVLLITNFVMGQLIAKKDVLVDLEFFNQAIINGHGANYNPDNIYTINTVILTVKNLKADSISVMDFRYYLGLAIAEVGCLHTNVKKLPAEDKMNSKSYFPIPIWLLNDSLVIGKQKKEKLQSFEGAKVLAINGKSSSYIMNRITRYSSADGFGSGKVEYANEIANYLAPKTIAYFLNYPKTYTVKTTVGSLQIKAANKGVFTYKSTQKIDQIPKILTGEKAFLHKRNDVFVLRIKKFNSKDFKFWSTVFSYLKKEKAPYLVIDLRGNTGGNRSVGAELMRYLAKTPFEYEILQPNLTPKPYFNNQGKRYYRFSKMKYNLFGFNRKKQTDLGKSFVYRFEPVKLNNYKGKIIILTDGLTASTSTMLTSWLMQQANAGDLNCTIIGRAAGGGYNGNNGGVFPRITLPKTKTIIRMPSYRLILDHNSANRGGIIPAIVVQYTFADWMQKKDKDWEAVLKFINMDKK